MAINKPESKQTLSTNNTIAVSAIATLVVMLVTAFLVKSLVGRILFNNKVIAKKQAASTQLALNVKAVEQLVEKYNQLENRVQLVNDALPTKPDFPTLVAMTESIAGASGVKLKAVNTALNTTAPTAAAAAPVAVAISGPVPFVYSAVVSGNYDSMMKFLANLELSSRPIRVLSIVHTGATADQTVDVKLQTYYQPAADISLKKEVVK